MGPIREYFCAVYKEIVMHKANRLVSFWQLALAGIFLLTACGEMQLPKDRPTKAVTISDYKSVAGNWSGLLRRVPKQSGDNFVELTISEEGRWKFAAARTIGVFSGGGNLTIKDGKLVSGSANGRSTFTLF
jgi:hypothetical protein